MADRTISYGEWERADDVAPILTPNRIDGSPTLRYAYRRRKYVTWVENDQKVGFWNWEYAS